MNRNSSPQAIATTRDSYDRFLAKFPLLFGYWKKYADLEFSIAGTEAAEMVRRVDPWFRGAAANIGRFLNEVSPASRLLWTCGRIIALSRLRQVMIPT